MNDLVKYILALVGVGIFIFFVSVNAQKTSAAKPNIIIILADDLGYHDVSYYGTKDINTPNIDALCQSGKRFDRFYTNAPVCAPTRASLMSGRYPPMVGVPGLIRSTPESNFGFLKPDALLLPKLLKQAGYHTALVGKWNLGLESPNLPNEKGFDLFHGFLDDMMNDYWTHLRNGKNFMRKNADTIEPKGHATDIFTQWAMDYILEQSRNKSPFFLYLAYNAPHAPIQPPDECLNKVKERNPGISDKRTALVALIEQLDNGIGKVIETLKKTGAYENSLIFFISDNGGQLADGANNGDLRDGKGTVYEGGIRVPAFVVWPGVIKEKTITKEPVQTMDVFPTCAEAAGITITSKIDGVSFLSLLKESTQKLEPRKLYFTRREGNMNFGGNTIQAVIDGDWKLLQNSPFAPYELYNLKDDPAEKNNLIQTQQERYKNMMGLMIKHIQAGGSVPWQKPESMEMY